ncbi:hypothetical protein NDU88_006232 [Pleurodeles waltl]|uniref:Uncharacterized protein n=1 Tax=Pleurodeles waltl TaxID=8319 RepID=A0AAV7MBM4_PLEWA|nr:hypothetical protein NDU88_006232 [Pleurodeles waltl]
MNHESYLGDVTQAVFFSAEHERSAIPDVKYTHEICMYVSGKPIPVAQHNPVVAKMTAPHLEPEKHVIRVALRVPSPPHRSRYRTGFRSQQPSLPRLLFPAHPYRQHHSAIHKVLARPVDRRAKSQSKLRAHCPRASFIIKLTGKRRKCSLSGNDVTHELDGRGETVVIVRATAHDEEAHFRGQSTKLSSEIKVLQCLLRKIP